MTITCPLERAQAAIYAICRSLFFHYFNNGFNWGLILKQILILFCEKRPYIMLWSLNIFMKSLSHFSSRECSLPPYDQRIHFTHTTWKVFLNSISDLHYHHLILFLIHDIRESEIHMYKCQELWTASTHLRTSDLQPIVPHFITLHEQFKSITEVKIKKAVPQVVASIKLVACRFLSSSWMHLTAFFFINMFI